MPCRSLHICRVLWIWVVRYGLLYRLQDGEVGEGAYLGDEVPGGESPTTGAKPGMNDSSPGVHCSGGDDGDNDTADEPDVDSKAEEGS